MLHKFILCGASRAGKSMLARRLQKRFSVNVVPGDALVSTMEDAFPDLGVSHDGDQRAVAETFETFIKFLLWNYEYEGFSYVFDSVHLRPQNIVNMRSKIGNVPSVFLGYAEVDPQEKLEDIRRYDPKKNWWSAEMSDEKLLDHIKKQISYSIECRKECIRLGIPYFETSHDFEAGVTEAEAFIVSLVS